LFETELNIEKIIKTFPKKLRLRKRNQFIKVQQKGFRFTTLSLLVHAYQHKDPKSNRIGITVSKKVGKSYVRSRVKRLIRESFRHSLLRQSVGWDLVLIAKAEQEFSYLSLLSQCNQISERLAQRINTAQIAKES
jgi:ribonuclease P protein component